MPEDKNINENPEENIRGNIRVSSVPSAAYAVDAGLRAFMLGIYRYMAGGLGLSGLMAFFTYRAATVTEGGQIVGLTPLGATIYQSPLAWVIMLAPLGFVFAMSRGVTKYRYSTLQTLFWLFAAVMGISLSSIFLQFTGAGMTRVFFITAGMFGALSLYGYTTNRDLTGVGTFMMMGLFGVIIAAIVNLFMQSSALQFAISVIVVLVFAGLTAWDTQKLKAYYMNYGQSANGTMLGRVGIMGALSLYLDFLNMFIAMLYLFGGRR